ncbi:3-deoxy-D-manno-octulosonic acid transferase [Marinoscillum furvescens]|uniref:3-deoxy-D-manno-octulosonic acid transferase n=1 Tax=Marinoscillum furvescens DSM 4134 TaxID=1122208 RepID=A0A3D9L5S3_MARFU|nr:glycosyltransferase N-terminal domain-containing protein [Marinoscillum furvescens]REE01026.1 3-deoxy-D-manno-octulosonic-acid transferase [Marinoscillum furvescens DSM 4134]
MQILYWLAVQLYHLAVGLLAPFHRRARVFSRERIGAIQRIEDALDGRKPGPLVWVHIASVGELEQAKPIIERLKATERPPQVLLTFFSPSGFKAGQTYRFADFVHYLPKDTPTNARRLVRAVAPSTVVFVKYDLWYFLLKELHRQELPVYVVCAHFRPSQMYFGITRRFWLQVLKPIKHYFVQSEEVAMLLRLHGIHQVIVAGDTRFDRVAAVVNSARSWPKIQRFRGEEPLMVLGSIWPSDMEVWEPIIRKHVSTVKWLIAPHLVDYTDQLLSLPHSVRYTDSALGDQHRILILDTMGMLSSVYGLGAVAYVGGAFRGALHNVLEPAAHGMPVLVGAHKKNSKFLEVAALQERGGLRRFTHTEDLEQVFLQLMENKRKRMEMAEASAKFIEEHVGASNLIVKELIKWI